MLPIFTQLDLKDPAAVTRALWEGARACREAACRRGSIEVIGPFNRAYDETTLEPQTRSAPTLIATGDLHDNPLHLARVTLAAGLGDPAGEVPRSHLTLHELIHSDNIVNHTDFSFRVLARAAALKAAFPEHVHVLLANHELAQLTGAEVVKEGVRCVQAFEAGIEAAFGEEAPGVSAAVNAFLAALPLALRVRMRAEDSSPPRDLFCAHSLPSAFHASRFDAGVFDRALRPEDYLPKTGAAYQLVWGRGHTPKDLAALGDAWGVGTFLLGHEKAENGYNVLCDRGVIINSDHEAGAYLRIDLSREWSGRWAPRDSVALCS